MKRFSAILMACLMLLCVTACMNPGTEPQDTEPTAVPSQEDPTAEPNEEVTVQNPIVTITMQDGGVMKLELYPDMAPNTVANFISLANSGFYDGVTFHRAVENFMIQGGDPNGDGTGGPDYSIAGEFTNNGFTQNTLAHSRGVISMARSQSYDSAGSQFFIMHQDYPYLDGDYAAFGMLIEGFDVLDQIATTETEYNAWGTEKSVPVTDQVIASIRVDTFGIDYGTPEKVN